MARPKSRAFGNEEEPRATNSEYFRAFAKFVTRLLWGLSEIRARSLSWGGVIKKIPPCALRQGGVLGLSSEFGDSWRP